ncbi:MAG: ABC transporter permease [Planctomycetota bacterium]|jgi:phospholipid/cholesterol/gamma-HCH transport system permease protein|nr:ABC transporter permease [Planctomycetota bacterium]
MFGIFEKIGGYFTNLLADTGAFVTLFIGMFASLRRAAPPWREIVRQSYFVGIESLPVIITTGAFVGMVISFQSYNQLLRLGVTSWVGPLVTASLVLQLGPVLSGVMLAGRVGSAMTAELGTMAVTEQIDALRTMGVNPSNYLVFPRVLASTVLCPLLTSFAILCGTVAGFGLCIYGLGINGHYMWVQSKAFLHPLDFAEGLTKAAIFGCAMAVICCQKGITTRGGAEGVGKSTTASNVQTCIAILLLNLLVTMVFAQIKSALL